MVKAIIIYIILLFILTIYSYSQIDLNLTLSTNFIYQSVQRKLILLGYYQRPASTIIFSLLVISLFICYFYFLKHTKSAIKIVIITAVILFFSYSAFSHDYFNYLFDARIVTKYGLNPYQYKALDFPGDLWTRFMHWTHRTYPYGPAWLALTIPVSYLGMQKFTLTYSLFKLLFIFGYLGSCYLIYKILLIQDPKKALYGLSFFAFNPLILIETIISPHNDSFTLFFTLLAIYFLLNKRTVWSFISMIISSGVKFITAPFLFLYLYLLVGKVEIKKSFEKIIIFFISLYIISIIIVIYYKEILSWYFIPVIGLTALVTNKKLIRYFAFIISVILLLRYLPFLLLGEWI